MTKRLSYWKLSLGRQLPILRRALQTDRLRVTSNLFWQETKGPTRRRCNTMNLYEADRGVLARKYPERRRTLKVKAPDK